MIKSIKISVFILTFICLNNTLLNAQNDTIFRAMHDELNRNMTELGKLDEYNPPFFIEYNLHDFSSKIIYATLGSVLRKDYRKDRTSNVRVMIGDYDLADENFKDNSINTRRHNDGRISLPYENDYLAIRRSFWIATNNVFKSASELYRNKLTAMDLKGLKKENLPAADLSKETAVTDKREPIPDDYNEEQLINLTTSLSKCFIDYPELKNSQIILYHLNSMSYMVNSEGSEISLPLNYYFLMVSVQATDIDEHEIWQQLSYIGSSIDDIPAEEIILKDIEKLVQNIKQEAVAEKFDEKYIGPLLYEDFAVVELNFMKLFSSGNESIIARRAPLVNNQKDGLIIPNVQTWEQRIGKRVIDSKISIYDISTEKSYNKQTLIGSYDIDIQAVKPSSKLDLIEKGILKNQLTNRTPTGKQKNSNGHDRLIITGNTIYSDIAPGVVLIQSDQSISKGEMKNKIIEMAKNEDLDYVIMAKTLETSAGIPPINYYKINIETGEEILLRSIKDHFDINDLRDIEYISDNEKVFNTIFYRGRIGYTQGVPVTFISPDAIIIKEKQLSGDSNSIKGEKPVVPSPLMETK